MRNSQIHETHTPTKKVCFSINFWGVGIIKKAGDYIRDGEVELIFKGPTTIMVQVGKQEVTRKKESGRQTDSCSCKHHARFNKINPRCAHKDAATTYLVMRSIE